MVYINGMKEVEKHFDGLLTFDASLIDSGGYKAIRRAPRVSPHCHFLITGIIGD